MSKKTAFRIVAPIVKVDAVERLVWGVITEEVVDKAGEILDYESSKPFFEKWSQGIAKATGGKSLGNVRAMHQPIAAGKLVSIDFDDAGKRITCCAKIVDDAEWAKVEAGVYTGFSMGGAYVRRWADPANDNVKRFTADPVEVSIVDNPCVPTAHFTMVKAGGVEEQVAFHPYEPTNDEVAERATAIAKAAGDEKAWADHVDEARDQLRKLRGIDEDSGSDADGEGEGDDPTPDDPVEKGVATAEGDDPAPADPESTEPEVDWGSVKQKQAWVTADGVEHAKKADAIAHAGRLRAVASASPLGKALGEALAQARGEQAAADNADRSSVDPVTPGLEAAAKALDLITADVADDPARKSLWDISSLAEALARLISVQRSAAWDAAYEGESPSAAVKQLGEAIRAVGDAFLAMAAEEIAEAVGRALPSFTLAADADDLTKAAVAYIEAIKADDALMAKVAPRITTPAAPEEDGAGDVALKAVETERDELRKQIDEAMPQVQELAKAVGDLRTELAKANAEIEKLKAEPAPMPQPVPAAGTTVVTKDGRDPAGAGKGVTAESLAEFVAEHGEQALAMLMIKVAQTQPMKVFPGAPAPAGA